MNNYLRICLQKKHLEIIEDDFGMVIRKNHPLGSAIAVLQNKEMFGEDSELIACLSLIHSKSTSGVKNLSSSAYLSYMVEMLYENQFMDGNRVYTFDINKLVESDTLTYVEEMVDGVKNKCQCTNSNLVF